MTSQPCSAPNPNRPETRCKSAFGNVMKNFTKLAIAAALTSPLLLVPARAADKDDRQPRTTEAQTQSQPQQPQPPQGQRRRFFDGQPPTAEQIREAEAFAEKYSPNRYHAFKHFAES